MKILKYLTLCLLVVGMFSCELDDNVNPKAPTSVPPNTIFTNAHLNLANQVVSTSVNFNITRLLVQYWQETTYFTESRYNFLDRNIPDNYWIEYYRDILKDLDEAQSIFNAQELSGILGTERDNKVAIAEICAVYAWHNLVDAFGNVPYSEALLGAVNSTPSYDDAETIYMDLISRLSAALNKLDGSASSYGSADLIYGGDVDSWSRFGASLLLRIGMRLSDSNTSAAQSAVSDAMSMGVITDASQNGVLVYNGVVPHVNGIYNHFVIDNRADYLPANTLIDMMNSMDDPRRALWFTTISGEYLGAVVGLDGAQSFNNFSNFTDVFLDPTLEAVLIDHTEMQFLMAEAVERGYISGSAEDFYNEGIRSNIMYWGGSSTDADTYLANAAVAYTTAAGDYKQKIGTQKWLALYNRSLEAWAEWRRLDHPVLNVPEGFNYSDIPTRMPYPYTEDELNEANYDAASAAMGGDVPTNRVFWDMN